MCHWINIPLPLFGYFFTLNIDFKAYKLFILILMRYRSEMDHSSSNCFAMPAYNIIYCIPIYVGLVNG